MPISNPTQPCPLHSPSLAQDRAAWEADRRAQKRAKMNVDRSLKNKYGQFAHNFARPASTTAGAGRGERGVREMWRERAWRLPVQGGAELTRPVALSQARGWRTPTTAARATSARQARLGALGLAGARLRVECRGHAGRIGEAGTRAAAAF